MTQRGERIRSAILAALLSMALGATIAGFYGLGRNRGSFLAVLLNGIIIGFSIYLHIHVLELVFGRLIRRLPERLHTVAHALLFLLGGISGWLSALVFVASVINDDRVKISALVRDRGMLHFIGFSGIIAVAVGLTIRAYTALKERLQQTTARLKEREWAEKELDLARKLQMRLLPPALIEEDGFAIASRNLAAHVVAGDFYDVVRLDDGSVVIVVADVAGKGMAASLVMASVKAVLPFVARASVAEAMGMLNEKLVHELDRREFVALVFARLFPDGTLHLANAGFPDPYLIGADGVRMLVANGVRLPLGIRESARYDVLVERIAAGERVLFVSDGLPEAPRNEQPLGYEELGTLVEQSRTSPDRGLAWLDALLQRVRGSVDEGLEDDWTAVVVERR